MDKRVNDILNDLYRIDPQFKAHEGELRTLVAELLASKPDTHFDESFASNLRARLMQTEVRAVTSPYTSYTSFFASRMFYGVLGSALTVLIVVPFTFIATQRATSPDKPVILNPFSTQVKDVASNSTLKQQISDKGVNAFGTFEPMPSATISAKGDASLSTLSLRAEGASTIASPDQKYISFAYAGDKIEQKDPQGLVYRRSATTTSSVTDATAIADMFLKGGAINSSLYGKPVETSSSEVVYPLLIGGMEVYDEFGNPFGLSVVVDPTEKRVVGINNPLALSYESSSYTLETNFSLILAAATSSIPSWNDVSISATLGTPKRVLMKYDGDLYVPAYLFPATYSNGQTGPKNIVVPIVKEYLEKINKAKSTATTSSNR